MEGQLFISIKQERLIMYRQGDPYCVQIEPTEGCNLRCSFCGLNGIRGKDNDFKFMTVETAERIASQMAELKWNSRIEIAMHGEPTANPFILDIIRIFREHLPKAYILLESNGGFLVKDTVMKVDDLFTCGLSTLAIDEYQNINHASKIFDKLRDKYIEDGGDWEFDDYPTIFGAKTYDYPSSGPKGNPHQRSTHKRLVRVRPIDVSTSGTHASLSNHCGNGAPENRKKDGIRCAKPFRELSFRWDGGVSICCNDWRGEMPVGNIKSVGLEDIWHSDRFYAMRSKLYHGERDRGACDGCDAVSYRSGLLPDPKGLEDVPPPTIPDLAVIDEMLEEGPLTTPVLRPWEK